MLLIDTTQPNKIFLFLFERNKIIAKINQKTFQRKSEKCLFLFDKILKKSKKKIKDLTGLAVMNQAGTFSDTRLGVILANCLSWSLKIPAIDILPSDLAELKHSDLAQNQNKIITDKQNISLAYLDQLRKIILNKIKKAKLDKLIKPLYTKEPNIILQSKN